MRLCARHFKLYWREPGVGLPQPDGLTDPWWNQRQPQSGYRIYAVAGLQLGRRKRRLKPRYRDSKRDCPNGLNEQWAVYFVRDQVAEGQVFRILVVMNFYSCECLIRYRSPREVTQYPV